MIIYWAMLLLPLAFSIHPVKFDADTRRLSLWLFSIVFILLIGLRHDVGGDWARYISIYEYHKGTDLDFSQFISGDYAYETIHWFSLNYLNGVYATNFICSIIFVSGLIRFCRTMPLPWLALFASVPFLVIVVSMGYTRQSAAMGFLLWALVDLIKGKTLKYYVYIAIGSLFHKTLLMMMPIGYIYNLNYIRIASLITFVSIFLFFLYFLLIEKIEHMLYYYVQIDYMYSGGAFVRVFISFIASIVFFIYRKEFKEKFHGEKLWYMFAVVNIFLLPLAYFYSTFADRIAIFFLPIQLVVLSSVPILIKSRSLKSVFLLCAITLYISSLFIWLNFGNHSNNWIPYQNILF
jgi:hypothetical protein